MSRQLGVFRSMRMNGLGMFLGLFFSVNVYAVDKPEIKFAAGATSASLSGEINGMDRDIYLIQGKAGQTLKVDVKNKYKLVLFRIALPNQDEKYLPKAGEEDDATTWRGKLPADGKYKIIVGAMRGKDTRYTLQVELK